MRVVLDTNTLVRAHDRSSAQARKLLVELLQRDHYLITSNEILAEVTRVLRYPKFQALYSLTESDLLEYIQFLQSVSQIIVLDPRYRAPLRDPTDLIVLQTAELGDVDVLCTHDRDFYDRTTLSYCTARGNRGMPRAYSASAFDAGTLPLTFIISTSQKSQEMIANGQPGLLRVKSLHATQNSKSVVLLSRPSFACSSF